MFKVAVAHSIELDSVEAVAELLDQCREQLGDLKPQAGLLFAGIDHDHAPVLEKIYEVYPHMELIGGTTDGEISSVHGFAQDSIVLLAFCSDELAFKAGVVDNISKDTTNTVSHGVDSIVLGLERKPEICIAVYSGLLPDGGIRNFNTILQGLKASLGENFPVFGGGAADELRYKCTYQFYNGRVFEDAVVFLLISGPLLYSFSVGTGQVPIGPKERVTKAHNNVVYEIGNKKAVQFFRHYLGEDIGKPENQILPDFPLAIFEDDDNCYYQLSVLLRDDDGNLITMGNVPEGSMVQITHTTRDKIVETAAKSIEVSRSEYPGTDPVVALCFSGGTRRRMLGTRVDEEYLVFKNNLPDVPVAGFYAYGEISPIERGRPAKMQTSIIVNLVLGLK